MEIDYAIRFKPENDVQTHHVHLNACANILDAIFNFYEAHGINSEILSIKKL